MCMCVGAHRAVGRAITREWPGSSDDKIWPTLQLRMDSQSNMSCTIRQRTNSDASMREDVPPKSQVFSLWHMRA